MTQNKYWRFDINNQSSQSGQIGQSQSEQTSQSGQTFVIVEANDQQSAMTQVKQLLNPTQSQNLNQPTQVDETQAKQYQSQSSAQSYS